MTPRSRAAVWLGLAGWLACLALAAALAWRAQVQPLVTDEIEFLETGPALWRGAHPLSCGGREWEELLHHPAAYHLLLGAIGSIPPGGLTPFSARLPGMVALFASAGIAAALARQLSPTPATAGEAATSRAGAIAAALLLSAPLALQGALLVDIDATVLTASVLAFLWLGCRFDRRTVSVLGLAALAFAALLWIKLPTPFMVLAAFALAGLLTPGKRTLALQATIVGGAGLLLFAASWALYCRAHDLDALAPVAHLEGRGVARASVGLATLAKRALRLLLWLGPWLPAAAVWNGLSLWRRAEPAQLARRALILFALVVAAGYLWLGGEAFGFPRYHMPLVACLAVLAAAGFRSTRAAWGLALAAGLYLLVIGDPLLPAYSYAETVAAGDLAAAEAARGVALGLALWLLPGLVLPFAVRLGLDRPSALVALALATGATTSVHQLRAPYSTHYMYGERGAKEARALLAQRAVAGRLTVAPKDLAFGVLACGSYVYSNRSLSSGLALELLQKGDLGLFVIRRGDLADARARRTLADPELQAILGRDFVRSREGDFLLYERRGPRQRTLTR